MTTRLELTGQEFRPLATAIQDLFLPADFDEMLMMRLNIVRTNITMKPRFPSIVFDVIGDANRKGYVHKLVNAARQERPGEKTFVEYAQKLGIGIQIPEAGDQAVPTKGELQSLINRLNMPIDVNVLLQRLGEIVGRVCRIDFGRSGVGTGFLVGPKAVLTNHHVMAPAIEDEARLTHFKCRFDYQTDGQGRQVFAGTQYGIQSIAAFSPSDPADLARNGPPDPNNLDYALLELEEEVGNWPIGESATPTAHPRGWIPMPAAPHHFLENSPLFIVQHPDGQPIKVAFEGDGIIGLNGNETRVEYKTNTQKGSSGSPCFDQAWELVALHHAGDPGWDPTWNAGVPIHLIRAQLAEQNLEALLN